MILMIDNYDSFTYNLVQYLGELGEQVEVFRNDEITLDEIRSLVPDLIVISPGPCTPNEAGISMNVVEAFSSRSLCLGFALVTRVSGRLWEEMWFGPGKLCMGKPPRFITMGPAYSVDCQVHLQRPGIIL